DDSTQEAINIDSFLHDVKVQLINGPTQQCCADKMTDISTFFSKAYMAKAADGTMKSFRDCKTCQ
ncbi:hypothetical protein PAXRUDRAFT_126509, partial [Paxillus rubicundulus Ve08.2h10]